jgi:thymidylate synthase
MGELAYLELLNRVLNSENDTLDRTGYGTLQLFGTMIRFDLATFPLLTTKKMPFKCILQELLWFIKGCTDANVLSKNGVKIWDAQSKATHGDCGPSKFLKAV